MSMTSPDRTTTCIAGLITLALIIWLYGQAIQALPMAAVANAAMIACCLLQGSIGWIFTPWLFPHRAPPDPVGEGDDSSPSSIFSKSDYPTALTSVATFVMVPWPLLVLCTLMTTTSPVKVLITQLLILSLLLSHQGLRHLLQIKTPDHFLILFAPLLQWLPPIGLWTQQGALAQWLVST